MENVFCRRLLFSFLFLYLIRKKSFAWQRSATLVTLAPLVRILPRYFALKRIQRAVRDLNAALAFECYTWRDVYYPPKTPSELPLERSKQDNYPLHVALPLECYTWRGVYYPRRVPSQLPSDRSLQDVLFSPRSTSVQTLRQTGHLLSCLVYHYARRLPFERYVRYSVYYLHAGCRRCFPSTHTEDSTFK